MQITFLVGNGFDISCGLNSSYAGFYDWYCKQEKSDKEHVNAFRDEINNDMKSGPKNWANFEEAMGKYTAKFSTDTSQHFIDCYEDAHKHLIKYLEIETSKFAGDLIDDEEAGKMREGLNNFYSELNSKEIMQLDSLFRADQGNNTIIRFISFNYTSVLDKCIEKAAKSPLRTWTDTNGHHRSLTIDRSVVHIHGRLTRHPVFGVDNEYQIANKELLTVPDFAELMIKPKGVNALGELWHDDSAKCINSSDIICIWGMSMGATDATWFSLIMDWLKAKENRQLIVFWHTDTPSNGVSNYLTLTNRRKAQTLITDYSDLTREKIEVIKQRIHIIENTKTVLRVKLRDNKGKEQ